MKVFLGWSGNLSRQLADTFRSWLKCVIQSAEPFLSSQDIDKGAAWHTALASTLQSCSFGIFFITDENLTNPWMHFEAGALSKEIGDSRVCPFLFGVHESMLNGPFSFFQAARFDEDDIFQLLQGLNQAIDKPLSDDVLRESFGTYWPRLQRKLSDIESSTRPKVAAGLATAEATETKQLRELVTSLLQRDNINTCGLRDVHLDRLHSLQEMKQQIDSEGKEIVIISSSLKGLIGIGGDSAGDQNLVRIALMDALKRGVKVKILMTNPVIAHHRSKQEGRERGEIECEIIRNLIYLAKERRENKEIAKNLEVKLYGGTPTIFVVCTSHTMFFNPYTYYSKAYETFCFSVAAGTPIYDTYKNNHYLAAWNDQRLSKPLEKGPKRSVKQLSELIDGTNQHDEPVVPDNDAKMDLVEALRELRGESAVNE